MSTIAVLIPAYKAEKTIQRTIASLNSNEEPHDIFIVDDGSPEPLETLITPQENLTILRADPNMGVSQARNAGLDVILEKDYEYVACLDADDVARPNRLKMQKEFLDQHPDIGLVGTWAEVVSETGETTFHLNPPTNHNDIINHLYYNNCFIQPSLMFRTNLFREHGLYQEDYPSAEDYEIIRRFICHTKVANISEYLVDYTISSQGISQTKRREQLATRLKLQWEYRNWFSPHFYLGITKTIMLNLVPYDVITSIKRCKKSYGKQ